MPYIFNTPTRIIRTPSRNPLLARTKSEKGITVLKNQDGSYTMLEYPSEPEIIAAAAVYLGGYDHVVSDAEADSLRAAGYTNLTPIGGP